jgi:hypothetical protein
MVTDGGMEWAFYNLGAPHPRGSWTKPRRCTSRHCKETRRYGVQLYTDQGKLGEAEKDVPAGTARIRDDDDDDDDIYLRPAGPQLC